MIFNLSRIVHLYLSTQRQKEDSVRIGQTGSCHSLFESLIIRSSRGENKTWWSVWEVRDSPTFDNNHHSQHSLQK